MENINMTSLESSTKWTNSNIFTGSPVLVFIMSLLDLKHKLNFNVGYLKPIQSTTVPSIPCVRFSHPTQNKNMGVLHLYMAGTAALRSYLWEAGRKEWYHPPVITFLEYLLYTGLGKFNLNLNF